MLESLPTTLLMQLCQASPEQVEAIERFLAGDSLRQREPRPANRRSLAGAGAGPTYVFRWTGRDWRVVFAGGEPFYLPDTLGAKYVDHLLHHPNIPVPAFDLEVAIQPEKGEARSRNSIQLESDGQARRQYRQALEELQARRQAADAASEAQELESLDSDIAALKAALEGASAPDTGKRARDNIRKAFAVVAEQLRKKGPEGSAFLQDLDAHLSIGLECNYSNPDAVVWD